MPRRTGAPWGFRRIRVRAAGSVARGGDRWDTIVVRAHEVLEALARLREDGVGPVRVDGHDHREDRG
jgi:hypothetical protein